MKEKRYHKAKHPRMGTTAKPYLRSCAKACIKGKTSCQDSDCNYWIDYEEDHNCTFIAIEKNENSSMTLREVAERMGVSFVRIKQIEDKALKKLSKNEPQLLEYLLKD